MGYLVSRGYSVAVLYTVLLLLYPQVCGGEGDHLHHHAPLSVLHDLVVGEVLPCCGQKYQRRRLVDNRACTARPDIIVRPAATEDVAITVNFARRNGYKVNNLYMAPASPLYHNSYFR